MEREWNDKIWGIQEAGFLPAALQLFQYQYGNNPLYREYADLLDRQPGRVHALTDIPFLPVRFFKSHAVCTGSFEPALVFESSGTTGSVNSRHLIKVPGIYQQSFRRGFELFFGDIRDYCILGLLPSYLERGQSSLVYMVNDWIEQSGHPQSGFYLYDFERLNQALADLELKGQRTILIGVTFALLDFAAAFPRTLRHTIVMETGGMKGRRRELVRAEVHALLKTAFRSEAVHSEYGMTELLSQAYAPADGRFRTVPWMKVLLRDEEDPLTIHEPGLPGRGAVNIIDLANIHSCAFLATDDAGQYYKDGSFEILGRLDNSDVRGCSLLTA